MKNCIPENRPCKLANSMYILMTISLRGGSTSPITPEVWVSVTIVND